MFRVYLEDLKGDYFAQIPLADDELSQLREELVQPYNEAKSLIPKLKAAIATKEK